MRVLSKSTQSRTSGKYLQPKLTISKKLINSGIRISLLIEFSIPELIFRNNIKEVAEENFDIIIQVLQDALLSMAVGAELDILMNARVIRIHYRTFNMQKNSTNSCKIPYSKEADGKIIRYHTISYKLIFYDNLKNLQTQ